MSDPGSTVHRITCAVARNHGRAMMERLSEMGVGSVLVESGRSVRRRRYSRFFGLLGYAERLEDSPIELCQFSVAPEASEPLVRGLAGALEMNLPGRGTIYAQECSSFVDTTVAHVAPSPEAGSRLPGLLRDLDDPRSLIGAIPQHALDGVTHGLGVVDDQDLDNFSRSSAAHVVLLSTP